MLCICNKKLDKAKKRKEQEKIKDIKTKEDKYKVDDFIKDEMQKKKMFFNENKEQEDLDLIMEDSSDVK